MPISLQHFPSDWDSDLHRFYSPFCKDLPLVARDSELNQLQQFMESEEPFVWCLVAGAAGVGKSKLCHEFVKQCEKLRESWHVLFYEYGKVKMDFSGLALNAGNNLIIVDDASIYDASLGKLLSMHTMDNNPGSKTRIVITIRSIPDDWKKPYAYVYEKESMGQLDSLSLDTSIYPFLGGCDAIGIAEHAFRKSIPSMILYPLTKDQIQSLIRSFFVAQSGEKKCSVRDTAIRKIYDTFKSMNESHINPTYALLIANQWLEKGTIREVTLNELSDIVIETEIETWKRLYPNIDDRQTELRKSILECFVYAALYPGHPYNMFAEKMPRQLEIIGNYFKNTVSSPDLLHRVGLLSKSDGSYVYSRHPVVINEILFLKCMHGAETNHFINTVVFHNTWRSSPEICGFLQECYCFHQSQFTVSVNLKRNILDESFEDNRSIEPFLKLLSSFVDKSFSNGASQILQRLYTAKPQPSYALAYITNIANCAYCDKFLESNSSLRNKAKEIYMKFKDNPESGERVAEQYARFLRYLCEKQGYGSIVITLNALREVYDAFPTNRIRDRYAKALLQKPNRKEFILANEHLEMFREFDELYKDSSVPLDVLEYEVAALMNCIKLSNNESHCRQLAEKLRKIAYGNLELEDLEIPKICCEGILVYVSKFDPNDKPAWRLILMDFKDRYPQEEFKRFYKEDIQPKLPKPPRPTWKATPKKRKTLRSK